MPPHPDLKLGAPITTRSILDCTRAPAHIWQPIADLPVGLADRRDLGVGEGSVVGVAPVVAAAYDAPVLDDHSSDGNFADGERFFGLL